MSNRMPPGYLGDLLGQLADGSPRWVRLHTRQETQPVSMETYVTGFAPPDHQWASMKAIWDACTAANVVAPDEVMDFFNGETPDPAGVKVELPLREWSDDSGGGYELDVAAIPKQVKTIRFQNTW